MSGSKARLRSTCNSFVSSGSLGIVQVIFAPFPRNSPSLTVMAKGTKMGETRLHLLMGDGPVSIVSDGILTATQYADLNVVVQGTFSTQN
jgi:hypothetical protein